MRDAGEAKKTTGGYRYGFNGKENDNEVKGEGNRVAFEARIYDPQVGRFLSIDPLTKNYPHQSPYTFAANNPIRLIDALGMGPEDPDDSEIKFDWRQLFGRWWTNMTSTFRGTHPKTQEEIEAKETSQQAADNVRHALEKGAQAAETYISLMPVPGAGAGVSYLKGDYVEGTVSLGFDLFGGEALRMGFSGLKNTSGKALAGALLEKIGANATRTAEWMDAAVVLGSDAVTMRNAARMVPESGIHQVLVHGNAEGFIVDGVSMGAKQLAQSLLVSGVEKGTTIRLVSCYTGFLDDGAAYQLSRYMKSPVIAPTNRVMVTSGGGYLIDAGGIFRTFFNTTIK